MTRTAYDSDDVNDIPADARMVFYYMDGESPAAKADLDRFADAVKLSITVAAHPGGDIADSEAGAMTPEQVAGWIRSRVGHLSTVYCDVANLPGIRAACAGLEYFVWAADWTGEPHAVAGTIGCQYASPAQGSGGHYDLSVITDDDWYKSPPAPLTDAEKLAKVAVLVKQLGALAG